MMPNKAQESLKNWGGNYSYQAEQMVSPESVEEIQEIVRASQQVKGVGTRHSFNGIADTTGTLISFAKFNRIIGIDNANQTVTIEAGVTYGQLCPYLDARGFGLPNLASLPHITVLGSCMTGTHGSGVNNQNLASSVTALEFVSANGDVYKVSQDDADFAGMVVSLGALGLITKITLKIIPRFDMWQQVFLELPHSSLRKHFDEIVSSAYSVSLFTTWQETHINQVWLKERAEKARFDSFFGTSAASEAIHPISGGDTQATTEQLGKVGAWYERLPHFRFEFQPSFGREIQSEYFVGIDDAVAAIEAIQSVSSQFASHLYITELRTVAADDLWLSPCYQRASVAIHFTWKPEVEAVKSCLPIIEAQLVRFGARPHWGKVFTFKRDYVLAQYERYQDFSDLVLKFDPEGKFNNTFLRNFQ